MTTRLSTGVPALDEHLGGGLLAGALTVVLGATGVGKTQLGLQIAAAGANQEGRRGLIFDVSARGDSQSHTQYAERMFGWRPRPAAVDDLHDVAAFFRQAEADEIGDYLHVFDYTGRRVTKRDLDFDQWHDWQAHLNQKLRGAIAFLYGGMIGGARRVIVDGIEPADRPGESIQFDMIEYVYHQILRKDPEWVARDLLRQSYRAHAELAAAKAYDPQEVACVLLATSREMMLEDLIARPLDEGDVISNANTLICMGKTRQDGRVGRGLYIAKHRGSACSEEILPFRITDEGLAAGV